MALPIGTRLGPYEITSTLGAGGMGEVYRATDTNLKRQVAIKVLPSALATDADRLLRFQREAEVLASLNHPNIAQIHGLEDSGGMRALVMELVEGPTLDDRIAQGAVPLDEALPVARQIAEALEAAHEHGIVHRDLKPSNIKLRPDGTVKVLDFGLAKALDPVAGATDASRSPTSTSPAITGMGVILGTAAYLSPEQARGKQVDRRADIWAFGCVLFELLTGKRAFDSPSMSDALASILMTEPEWSALPAATPSPIRTLLARCLQKDVQKRLPHIGVAKLEIDEALAAPALPASPASVKSAAVSTTRRMLRWFGIGIVGVAAALFFVLWASSWRTSPVPPLQRLTIELGADESLTTASGPTVALSPDGQTLAFVMGSARGASQLYVRRLDQLRATPLAGTDGARAPFFSPDGRWIAFVADGVVKKIAATGGGAITLGRGGVGGAWGQNGIIVVSTGVAGPLVGMSSDGGTATTLTTLAEGEITHRWPQLLPEGNAVLYTASNSAGTVANANVVVQALPKGPRRILQKGATYGRFLPSGHIVYVHEGTLFAMPFDPVRLEPTGTAVPVLEGVTTIDSGDTNAAAGAAQFAVANTGTLVYLPGRQLDANAAPVVWMNRAGETMPLRAVSADWSNLTFSPDGRRVAMDILDRGTVEVWVYDWTRDQLSPLTSHPADDLAPTWTPDGRRIVFSSNRAGRVPNLYWQSADGSGDAQRLATSPFEQWATSWHPSGKFLAVREVRPETGSDVLILPMEGDETRGWRPGTPTVFVNTRFEERMPEFSPDGRWLAYTSNESGRYEVYVRPFPGPGSRWLVSVGGSSRTFAASWSRTRQELLYESPDGHVMVVPFTTENGAFRADKPRLWPGPPHLMRARWGSFELHPDGERVAMAPVPAPPASAQNKVVLVLNFFDELRRVAPSPR